MLASPPIPLQELLDQLDAAFADPGQCRDAACKGSWLLRVEGGPSTLTLGMLELDHDLGHPVDALLGLHAEPTWSAVGLVVHGVAHQLDTPAAGQLPPPVRAIYAVSADGTEATVLRYLDDRGRVSSPGPPEGRLRDCCRRIMGLPTATPLVHPLHWLATRWLSDILITCNSGPLPTWAELVALHPLQRGSFTPAPSLFARSVAAQTQPVSWAALRQTVGQATDGGDRLLGKLACQIDLAPFITDWMDDGMFARWLLSELPEAVDLLIDLAGLLRPATMESLMEVAEIWKLW